MAGVGENPRYVSRISQLFNLLYSSGGWGNVILRDIVYEIGRQTNVKAYANRVAYHFIEIGKALTEGMSESLILSGPSFQIEQRSRQILDRGNEARTVSDREKGL